MTHLGTSRGVPCSHLPATVEYVVFDSNPFTSINGLGVIDNEYAALPQPFLDALADLGTHLDSAKCWRCGDPVGFVLTVQPVGERLFWTETGLARQGDGAVAVLCGPCTPYVPTPDDPQSAAVSVAAALVCDGCGGDDGAPYAGSDNRALCAGCWELEYIPSLTHEELA